MQAVLNQQKRRGAAPISRVLLPDGSEELKAALEALELASRTKAPASHVFPQF